MNLSKIEIIIDLIEDYKCIDSLSADSRLLENILDSFDLIALIDLLEQEFKLVIPIEEVVPENFHTPESISFLLEKLS